ncbi:MAG: hypothetical protein WA129_14610, partial [Acidovorax sp.]
RFAADDFQVRQPPGAPQILGIPGNSLRFDASVQAFTAPVELVDWFGTAGGSPRSPVGCAAAHRETCKGIAS